MYFVGQGKVFIGSRDNLGNPEALRFVGNVPSLKFSLKTEVIEHKESTTGQRATDARIVKGKSADFSCSLEDFSQENLALVLYGSSSQIASGTVTAEAFPVGLAAGDFVALKGQAVTSVVIKDSAATPATLVAGTDYELNADHGSVRILNAGTYVQPFTADYSRGAVTTINMLTQPLPERFVRFEGLNIADSNKAVLIELYRVAVDPLKELAMIGEAVASFDLSGSVMIDALKAGDPVLGQFGRIVQI